MAYPSFAWVLTSENDGDSGVVLDRAQDGTTRGRAFFTDTKRTFVGRHILTKTEVAELMVHYEANKVLPFDIAWTGQEPGTYTVFYRGRPKTRALSPDAFDVEVPLVEQ